MNFHDRQSQSHNKTVLIFDQAFERPMKTPFHFLVSSGNAKFFSALTKSKEKGHLGPVALSINIAARSERPLRNVADSSVSLLVLLPFPLRTIEFPLFLYTCTSSRFPCSATSACSSLNPRYVSNTHLGDLADSQANVQLFRTSGHSFLFNLLDNTIIHLEHF